MKKAYRIFFIVPPLFGHIGPSLPVVKHLRDRGHIVAYFSGPPAESTLTKTGIDAFFSCNTYYDTVLNKQTLVKGFYEFYFNVARIYTVERLQHYYKELINALDTFNPDVVYLDTYDFIAEPVISRLNIPFAHVSAMVPAFFERDIPPIGTGWDIEHKWLNRFRLLSVLLFARPFIYKRKQNQKKALQSIYSQWNTFVFREISPYLYLLFSTDQFEYPRKRFIPQVFYIGPSINISSGRQLSDFPWQKIDTNRPLIYVATGTLFIEQYKTFYQYVLAALTDDNMPFPVHVVMAIGKQEYIDTLGKVPPNFTIVRYAPQLEILEKASLFITHGGVNSVNEALWHGTPMLVVHYGGDRLDVGRRVAYRNAGICMDLKDVSPETLRKHTAKLIQTPAYTQAAAKIKASYRMCRAGETAGDLILHLAQTRRPVYRSSKAPITFPRYADFKKLLKK